VSRHLQPRRLSRQVDLLRPSMSQEAQSRSTVTIGKNNSAEFAVGGLRYFCTNSCTVPGDQSRPLGITVQGMYKKLIFATHHAHFAHPIINNLQILQESGTNDSVSGHHSTLIVAYIAAGPHLFGLMLRYSVALHLHLAVYSWFNRMALSSGSSDSSNSNGTSSTGRGARNGERNSRR
jgi:hypothetical protein